MDIEQTLAERGQRYGSFADHAEIVQQFKITMRGTPGFRKMAADQQQALEVIVDKIARILNGDPDYLDNWHDIIGYARLIEKRLEDAVLVANWGKDAPTESAADLNAVANASRRAFAEQYPELIPPAPEKIYHDLGVIRTLNSPPAPTPIVDTSNSSINDDGILF